MLDCEIVSSRTNSPWLRIWTRWSGIERSAEAAPSQESCVSSVLVLVLPRFLTGWLEITDETRESKVRQRDASVNKVMTKVRTNNHVWNYSIP